jgi:hypothetical protein
VRLFVVAGRRRVFGGGRVPYRRGVVQRVLARRRVAWRFGMGVPRRRSVRVLFAVPSTARCAPGEPRPRLLAYGVGVATSAR